MDKDILNEAIVQAISESDVMMTPLRLESLISNQCGVSRKEIRNNVRYLVGCGELEYVYEYGSSFLVLCFNRPVRVSEHVILKPPEIQYDPDEKDVVVNLQKGVSFGSGRHPTTNLCIRAMDKYLWNRKYNGQARVLDVGTGNGILSIAAVCLGMKQAIGIDVDINARVEAKNNVKLNALEAAISIGEAGLDSLEDEYELIVANLRFPTIQMICSQLSALSASGGKIIISGIREDEAIRVISGYCAQGFKKLDLNSWKGWSCVVFEKPSC